MVLIGDLYTVVVVELFAGGEGVTVEVEFEFQSILYNLSLNMAGHLKIAFESKAAVLTNDNHMVLATSLPSTFTTLAELTMVMYNSTRCCLVCYLR